MLNISVEKPEETGKRLLEVLKNATVVVMPDYYRFLELKNPIYKIPVNAIAIIRDKDNWSALMPSKPGENEVYAVFKTHFNPNDDNSGFVGWMASRVKEKFGSGVFVICGYNKSRGGIFDYMGVPASLKDDVVKYITGLRAGSDVMK